MSTSDYLRRQAENCLRIARSGFDLATAERLRHMAADLQNKADELDEQQNRENGGDGRRMAPHMMNGNGSRGSGGNADHG